MKLSLPDQQRANTFIRSKARPLEQALYRFHFVSSGPDGVLSALAAYQNPNGGYGHGKEMASPVTFGGGRCTSS